MKRLIVLLIAAMLLVACGNKEESGKSKEANEYELIEPETYRVLAPSIDDLVEKYTDIRKLNSKLPKIENIRSDDGHIRGKTFDENDMLSFHINADDTVNSIHYIGGNVLILNTIIQLLDIDEHDAEVRKLLADAGKSYRNEESFSGEVVYDGIELRYTKGTTGVYLDVYGVD